MWLAGVACGVNVAGYPLLRRTMAQRLGPLQRHMLEFCRKHPGHHTISPDWQTRQVAQSLQRRGLLHVTDCGMSTATGQPVLMVSAANGDRKEP